MLCFIITEAKQSGSSSDGSVVSALHDVCIKLLSRWDWYGSCWIGYGLLHTSQCRIQEALVVVGAPANMSIYYTCINNGAEFHSPIFYLHWRCIFYWTDIERQGYILVKWVLSYLIDSQLSSILR